MKIDQGQLAKLPGDKLPNHSVLLVNRWLEITDEHMYGIVLACTGAKVTPFVTWERTVDMATSATGRPYQIDQTFTGHYHQGLGRALEEYNERVESRTHEQRDLAAVKKRGYEDGVNAATWMIDGNTPTPYLYLNEIIQGMEDGDPEIMDRLPVPHYNGEWADAPTWDDILRDELEDYDVDDDTDHQELMNEYDLGFHEGVEHEIRRMHRSYAPDA